jgi:MFS family permease
MSSPSRQSLWGLNAANFFQAEMVGVVLPVLNTFLRESHWRFDAIGIATAAGGLGTLLMQTPAGILIDRLSCRRLLFAAMCVLIGLCYLVLPLVPRTAPWIDGLLFLSGVAGAFFAPLLGALALGLVGHKALDRVLGENQGWNHAGNLVAAAAAIAVVAKLGPAGVFYSVGVGALLAVGSVLLIRADDIDETRATGRTDEDGGVSRVSWRALLGRRTVLLLFVSVFAFHFANAPIMPQVALYVHELGGSDKLVTSVVLSAQAVMIPVAWLSGIWCQRKGRKPVFAFAFLILPLRILSYTMVHSPVALVVLQSLDGIGAGIYGVVILAMAADLTKGKGGFNTLNGLFATAVAVGGVAGPILAGVLTEHLGFCWMFTVFALLAAGGCALFLLCVPETAGAVEQRKLETVSAA